MQLGGHSNPHNSWRSCAVGEVAPIEIGDLDPSRALGTEWSCAQPSLTYWAFETRRMSRKTRVEVGREQPLSGDDEQHSIIRPTATHLGIYKRQNLLARSYASFFKSS